LRDLNTEADKCANKAMDTKETKIEIIEKIDIKKIKLNNT